MIFKAAGDLIELVDVEFVFFDLLFVCHLAFLLQKVR